MEGQGTGDLARTVEIGLRPLVVPAPRPIPDSIKTEKDPNLLDKEIEDAEKANDKAYLALWEAEAKRFGFTQEKYVPRITRCSLGWTT